MISQSLKLKDGETLRVESFKGDRWLEITRKRGDGFSVTEHGFKNATYEVGEEELRQLLRRLIDFEFPRSHQLRVSKSKG
ncbi:hypothetical protein ASAC_0043 [Acidilobus saccharovorans 345-15]|uniref:Uncharacterized protein n=1 Tax=Acidilobus saccharovorans (strain DSM 16705 / JCM 18335 / VKM B-2471 / 345-15) TaxID=666510 RepID=D9PZG3_ACIS3|nr:hypothetical protein [Acidilobus saccharovorans]ADL18451.1 hypothetical protein ASAC_0043 [Acidilobus saccharovorans 345-15]